MIFLLLSWSRLANNADSAVVVVVDTSAVAVVLSITLFLAPVPLPAKSVAPEAIAVAEMLYASDSYGLFSLALS